jgi:hypothetical protein
LRSLATSSLTVGQVSCIAPMERHHHLSPAPAEEVFSCPSSSENRIHGDRVIGPLSTPDREVLMKDSGPSWPSAVVAVALIALVGVFFWKSVGSTNFSQTWAAVGTIVGVVSGSIPSYFFKKNADQAQQEATTAKAQTTALAAAIPPEKFEETRAKNPSLFSDW